jgi:hypothetical protein
MTPTPFQPARRKFRSLAPAAFMVLAIVILGFQAAYAQNQKTGPPSSHTLVPGIELPVTLRQNVTAGITPPGTKIQARLTIATLINGVVIPEGATLTGEVTVSTAKSAKTEDSPSRLSIRLDSARWKAHPEPLQLSPSLYLTEWFYPPIPIRLHDHDRSSESAFPDTARNPGFGTGGIYPGQRNPTGPPISAPTPSDTSTIEPLPPTPHSDDTQHRVQMKSVECTRSADGALLLDSKTQNIKLDKNITYVFASGVNGAAQPEPRH